MQIFLLILSASNKSKTERKILCFVIISIKIFIFDPIIIISISVKFIKPRIKTLKHVKKQILLLSGVIFCLKNNSLI